MSAAQLLFDLGGPAEGASANALSQRLASPRGPVIIITDYQGAPFGVEALPAHHQNLAPLLEKRLRDEGDIDGLARVLMHACERQGDFAQTAYTAVPVAVHMAYQRWVKQQSDHVLLFPLLEALILLAQRQQLVSGVLAFVHDESVDVLVFQDGSLLQASRQRLYANDDQPYRRIAAYIHAQQVGLQGDDDQAECVLIERTSDESQLLVEALKEAGTQSVKPALPARLLFDQLNAKRADLDGVSRSLYLANRIMPLVAAVMVTFCLTGAGGALYWKHQASSLQAELNEAQTQSLSQTFSEMNGALGEAQIMAVTQRERAEFVRLSDRVRRTPDPASLIRDLRQTVPAGIDLTEAGIVSDDAGVLILVAGRSASVAAPFAAEERFVEALQKLGYEVERREITSGLGNSLFRLALTWSEK